MGDTLNRSPIMPQIPAGNFGPSTSPFAPRGNQNQVPTMPQFITPPMPPVVQAKPFWGNNGGGPNVGGLRGRPIGARSPSLL